MRVTDKYDVSAPDVHRYSREVACANPDLVIGLELETENCDSAQSYTKLTQKTNFVIEQDGSLRGQAFEFISRPMRSANALAALEDFLAGAKFGPENYSDRCSVHVHVNCTDMEFEQILGVTLLYTVFEEILFDFVGEERDNNIYCIPWNQCRNHLDLVHNFLNKPDVTLKRWVKYTALNLQPLTTYGTVEFRHMHGTADIKKLTTWIDAIGGLFAMAKTMAYSDIEAMVQSLNTSSEYEMLFRKTFGDTLVYDQGTAAKMEEGVIFAKYSLVAMKTKKGTKAKPEVRVAHFAGGQVLNMDGNMADILHEVMHAQEAIRPQMRPYAPPAGIAADGLPAGWVRRPPPPPPVPEDYEQVVEDEEGEF